MAAGIGNGIGAFMAGLAGGVKTAADMENERIKSDYYRRHMDLLESADKRAASKEDRDALLDERKMALLENADKRSAAEADRTAADYSANAPLLAAKRAAGLTELNDAADERSAKQAAGQEAVADFRSNPQKYGSFAEAFRAVALPKIQEHYLSKGDTATADAFSTWADKQEIKDGINNVGRINQSLLSNDWDGASKHLNTLMKDKSYLPDTGWKRSFDPIKDKDGKTIGLRLTSTAPDGKSENVDSTDIADVYGKLMPMISPQTAFEFSKKQYEDQQAAKSERAKGLNKLSDEIDLERVKSASRIAEERAKALGPQGMKDYSTGVLQVMKYQSENNPGFAKLPPDQQAAQSAAIYEQVRARSGHGGGQPVPTTRNLGVQSTAPAPAPKSIMPAFTGQNYYDVQ
ncbi:MAG: hypothetical protein EKK29_05955 [Hyphomicrobiales bacterium]|nr:MAG: hypothetical protein EKK29_05955 [Hyphomicrobiales bacterium]